MHEVGLVSALIEQVEVLAMKHRFRQVETVRLGVGLLSGVNSESLEFCFPEVTRQTILQGSQLILEILPIEAFCNHCRAISNLPDPSQLLCPVCRSNDLVIRKGKDFLILDIEVNSDICPDDESKIESELQ